MNDLMDRTAHDLRAAAQQVQVPAYDPLAVRRRLRARRTARTAGVGLVAAAAAGVVLAASLLAPGPGSGDPTVASPGAVDLPPIAVIDATAGEIAIVQPDGSLVSTGLEAPEEILGEAPGGFVAVGRDSRIVRYRFEGTGARLVEPPYDAPVQRAVASTDGSEMAWLDLRGRVHLLTWGSEPVLVDSDADRLYDVAGGQVALSSFVGGSERITLAGDGTDLDLPAQDFVDHVSVAREPGLAAVSAVEGDGAEVRPVDRSRSGYPAAVPGQGVLAPDGEHLLVSRATEEEAGDVVVLTRRSSEPTVLLRGTSPTRMLWLDDERVLVGLLGDRRVSGEQADTLVVCDVAAGSCETAYEGGPVTLPTAW